MTFEWFALPGSLKLDTAIGVPGILVTLAYLAACAVIASRGHADFRRFKGADWLLLAGLIAAALILTQIFIVEYGEAGTPGQTVLPMLALLTALIAAVRLGAAPALTVGFISGLALSLTGSGRITQSFETALTAGVVGLLVKLPYRGRAAGWLRQPLIAALLASLVIGWPLTLLGQAVTDHVGFFASLDRMLGAFFPILLASVAGWLLPGLIVQAALAVVPGPGVRRTQPLRSPPWEQHLGQRMVYRVVPLAALAVLGLMGLVVANAYAVATNIVIERMASSAANARASIPFLVQEGRSPSLAPIASVLQTGAGSGQALLIDGQSRIVLFPAHPEREGQYFKLGAASEIAEGLTVGRAYRQAAGNGARNLIYILPIGAQPDWSIVLIESNEAALRLMLQNTLPTLILLLAILGMLGGVGLVIVRGITNPLEDLLKAVRQIGDGDLEHSVRVSGEDEIGQLGLAFEQLRERLRQRLDEQERLLRVSRGVSSSLELFRAIPPILSSALDVTHAVGVRIALRQGSNGALQSYFAGEAAPGMAALDLPLADLVEQQGTVVISQVRRARGALDLGSLPPRTQALVALPLRSENTFHGILWLVYDHEHEFEQSELTFLGTLAGQAAVAIANSKLLAEAQEGRQRVEAILESTADGMIVVDNQGRITLMNPAAEAQFNVRQEHARGRPAGEIIPIPQLAALLTDLKAPSNTLELPGRNGKTLLANTSTIVGHDGTISGRVTLLRDITPIKELDNIKTVFLRMVSHDLRSPLTYMRGFLTMMPVSGSLNEAQEEALKKVNAGIQQISEMTERLLYLSRLKFGDEAELELTLVDVEQMLNEIKELQSGAAADKSITLTIETDARLPLLLVDGILYQQALGNLINNAIKYGSEGGEVVARAFVERGDQLVVSVRDNGAGIRPEDQGRLFEAFYRVPQREDEPARPPGTGLGLALVKAIAEAHNGLVEVQSTFGEGSTFSLRIPIRNPADF